MRLLLHACCGPCLLEPYDALAAEHDVEVAYANPNIHPIAEYERRRDTLLAHTDESDIPTHELDYDPISWMRVVAGVEDDQVRRCRACYRLRLGMVADYAAANGFEAISTTLTVSPYQDPEVIREEGEAAAARAGVVYVHRDFRERYPQATRRSRELEMYRQNYCGCMLSDIEARQQRERRKAERKAARMSESGPDRP